jgi:hypothetical protein
VRYRRMKSMLATRQFEMVVYTLVSEPLRLLTSHFLYISWWTDRSRAPPLLDLLQSETSMVHAALQYYGDLLDGSSPRLSVVHCLFPKLDAAQLTMLRRAILAAAGAVYRRHVVYLRRWRFWVIADPRLCNGARLALARELLDMPPCCLRPGMYEQMVERAKQVAKADRPGLLLQWSPAMVAAAFEMRLSIADIERCHAKNRRRTHAQNRFSLLAARFLNGELKNRFDARLRLKHEQQELPRAEGTQLVVTT